MSRKPFQFGLPALLGVMAVVAFLLRAHDPWAVAAVDLVLFLVLIVACLVDAR